MIIHFIIASTTMNNNNHCLDNDFHFFFIQCMIKQLLDSVFVISRIVKAELGVISLNLWLRLITPTSTLIILGKLPVRSRVFGQCTCRVCSASYTFYQVQGACDLNAGRKGALSITVLDISQKKRPFLSNSFPLLKNSLT